MLNPNGLSCTTAISNMHHSLKYLVKSHKIMLKSNMVSLLSADRLHFPKTHRQSTNPDRI